VQLREAIAAKSGNTMRIKLIGTGWNVTGSTYYSEAMLRESGASAFPVGTQMFWNHPTVTESQERPERDLDFLAAVIVSTPVYSADDAEGPGLYAECKVFSDYEGRVKEIADYIGLSIYALAAGADGEADGQVGRIIEKLIPSPFNTVDFVTVPGAGGEIVQIFESAGRHPKVVTEAAAAQTNPTPETNPTSQGESTVTLDEQLAEALKRIETLETQDARQSESIVLNQAEALTSTVLAGYDTDALPQMTRTRLQESLSKRPVLAADGTIDREATKTMIAEAVTAEVKYLQESTGWGTGATRNLGQTVPLEPITKEQVTTTLQESLGAMGLPVETAKIAASR
jgi:hypothetical protein